MDQVKNIIHQIEEMKSEQKFGESIRIIEKALISHNNDYRLYEELADIYLYKGELEKGLKAINFALTIHPQSATGNYLKGFLLLSKDRTQEAIKFLEKSNTLIGNNSEVLRNLGWAYTMTGETSKGIAILKRALNLNPDDELITEDLAMALIGNGSIHEGNNLLQKIGKCKTHK